MLCAPNSWTLQLLGNSGTRCEIRNSSVKLIPKLHKPVVDPVLAPSNNGIRESRTKSSCVDVPLTKKGVEEAIEAGRRISNIPVDMIYTSALIRAQMTAMLAMTQHRRKKVPIIMHNESEQAKAWSQIYSEETIKQSIPVIAAWQLNERISCYCAGTEKQGLNKQETAERFGRKRFTSGAEVTIYLLPMASLEMCAQRAVAYFKDNIEPQLQSGKNVMIAAHGNSLRSIIMYLDKLPPRSLELSTGIPMLYIFKEENFIRREVL
ncbi:pollen-specific protein C13-like [Hibiscus syriacus]|uniref:phosphoglycerate mutase (2,3-diphosphoglycerate-dependent) n=1 Tax=Hibiscus syriacus TaxID=106335 RepID=A0A6A2YLH6_HIBSY|nr:pollen-specific protein C13-like [Hibiscus syriacus]